ncbi:uncharacterized protein [Dendrobates tinctorius]|uniref:uncharacterized protein isoform X2 n=1 Tax=Dendrobates tinctorius TaxID=92724 RepID=UPI003CCA6684
MHRSSGMSEKNVREILSENTELKKFHEQMRREVQAILGRHEGVLSVVTTNNSAAVNKRMGAGRTRPNRVGDVGLTVSLKKQWNSLKQLVEILEARATQANVISVTDHEKELTRLKKEVEELKEELGQSRELISQQQQLLQDQLMPLPGEGQQSPLWDAYFLEEQLRLQQDRAAFEEHKLAFQDERDKFTEAAIRLGRERLQFKADQALFMKQQFLNMTPSLGTPPWKKTPPWSALKDTPNNSSSNPKQQATVVQSCGTKPRRKLPSVDPGTPSTAELYRVLRLAPPSRYHRCESSSHQDTESEESNQRWCNSLSPSSESPELHPLPQFVIPFKLSMTPYLRPRPTPVSLPRSHSEPRTPATAEIFRTLRLTPADSIPSVKKGHGDELRRSILHHSHRRASISKVAESPCCSDDIRRREEAPHCSHELSRADCEMDSLSFEDSRQTHGEADTPNSDVLSSTKENSECFDNDSLYRVTPLHDTTYIYHGENMPHLGVDDHCCSQHGDQSLWPCKEKFSTKACSNGTFNKKPKVTLQADDRRSCDTLQPQDACRSGTQERPCYKDRCRTRSKEDIRRRSLPCHQSKVVLHFEDDGTMERSKATPHGSSKRRRSLDSLHKHVCKAQSKESHSLHKRSSCPHREYLYTSVPGCSPFHLRHSCPSAQNAAPCTTEYVVSSSLYADLLTPVSDCSF